MSNVPYASAIGSLMYAMVCIDQTLPMQWDFEQVYVKTEKGALDSCKEGV